jgi:hypothetical protein
MVNATPRPLYSGERESLPIAQDVGWDPGPACRGVDNLVPHRDSISQITDPIKAEIPLAV